MLKIKDKNGKTIMILNDDANEPVVVIEGELEQEETEEETNQKEKE